MTSPQENSQDPAKTSSPGLYQANQSFGERNGASLPNDPEPFPNSDNETFTERDNTLDNMIRPQRRQTTHCEDVGLDFFTGGIVEPRPRLSANFEGLMAKSIELAEIADNQSQEISKMELKSPLYQEKIHKVQ